MINIQNLSIVNYIFILFVSYIVLFIFFSFLKAISKKMDKLIFCSVCFSWATMLIIGLFLGFNLIILAFLLGMSITGLVYKIDEYLNYKNKTFIFQHFVIQLIFTIIGLLIISQLKGG